MAKTSNNKIYLVLNDQEVDKVLENFGALTLHENLMSNPKISSIYESLVEAHDLKFPRTLPSVKGFRSGKFFKDCDEFTNQLSHYLKKVLAKEYLEAFVKYQFDTVKATNFVEKRIDSIFERTVSVVYNNVMSSIYEEKLYSGQQPFGDIF